MEHRKPGDDSLAAAVLRYARERPQLGQAKVAAALARQGHAVSPSGVRYIWRQHDLETTYKRLKALAREEAWQPTSSQSELLRRGDVKRRVARRAAPQTGSDERSDERRGHILLAAAELFSRHGYGGTSIRDIAGRVGLLAGSVYHYFPAKEDLFVAVHQEGFRLLQGRVLQAIGAETEPWRRLELACAEHIAVISGDHPIQHMAGSGLFAIHEPHLQRRVRAERDCYENIFRSLIAALDLPRGTDRSLFRLSLLGALNWSLLWYKPGKRTPREIARRLVGLYRSAGTQ